MLMRPINFIQHKGQADTIYTGTAKMRGKLVQQAHWASEIAVEEHKRVVIKLEKTPNPAPAQIVFGLGA